MLLKHRDKTVRILIHVLVWSLITFLLFRYPLFGTRQQKMPEDFLLKQIAHIILMISAYYINAYYLVPKLLLKQKVFQFLAGIVLLILLSSFALSMVDAWLKISLQLEQWYGKKNWSIPYIDFFGLLTTCFVMGISSSIAIIDKWNSDSRIKQNLESEKVKDELSFLKAQIHPHFFFNTLNSIYALTYVDVEASRKVLHKLSRMMRYLLYETNQNKTLLSKELAFIQDYVEIMKLRVNKNTSIQFSYPVKESTKTIAPMLLLPYVENAFKYGIDDVQNVVISIDIKETASGLELNTKNKIVGKIGGLYEESDREGIGMANTKRRLDLLYENKYLLKATIDNLTNEYHLQLQLSLK